jgi:hypothetical protein
MGITTSLYPDLPQFVIKCLDLYDQRLKTEAATQLKVVGVYKVLTDLVCDYVCCPREMLKEDPTDGPFMFADVIRDAIPTNTKLVPLLPDFIECFRDIHAPGLAFIKPNIAPSIDDVVFARYTCLDSDMLQVYARHIWERAPLPELARRCALRNQSMYLTTWLTPTKSDGAIPASDIVNGIFGSFGTSKQRRSAEAFPFFVEVIRHWSDNWSRFDMDDAIAIVGRHTELYTGQKDKAWKLFQYVSPVKKAAWVAARREDKAPDSVYYRARYWLAAEDANSMVKMVKDFTVETATEWPKLKKQKKEKRKASSLISGKGKRAKCVTEYESDPEY